MWMLHPDRDSVSVYREQSMKMLLFWEYIFKGILLYIQGASVAEWLRCRALKLLAPLRWGSTPMRGSCQLLTEGCWFTPTNNVFLQLWKLTAIYNQTWLKNGVKH